jgi:hypothetical protein
LTPRNVAAFFLLGFAAFTVSKDRPEKAPLRIANPKELSIEMAKAVVSGDRKRFTALAATREEMVGCSNGSTPSEPERAPGAEGTRWRKFLPSALSMCHELDSCDTLERARPKCFSRRPNETKEVRSSSRSFEIFSTPVNRR